MIEFTVNKRQNKSNIKQDTSEISCYNKETMSETGQFQKVSEKLPDASTASILEVFMSSMMLDYAVRYAKLGWRVFPVLPPNFDGTCSCHKPDCKAAGKHPAIAKWQERATAEGPQLRKWWEENADYNIGIATGSASGVLVLDTDGPTGLHEAQQRGLPITPTARTGRLTGGTHFYFTCPAGYDARNFAGRIPGLDARANGGYVVAPPSRHASGAVYQWVDDPWNTGIAAAPAWLSEELGGAGLMTPNTMISGERNTTLFSMGRSMRALGYSEDGVLKALRVVNMERCKPPLEDNEVVLIAANACKIEYAQGPDLMLGIQDPDFGAVEITGEFLRQMPRTEIGTAECFTQLHQGKLLWVPEWKVWLRWNGAVWTEDKSGASRRAMMQTIRARGMAASMLPDKEERATLQKWARSFESNSRIEGILNIARTLPQIHEAPENFDLYPLKLGMPNGTWDFETATLLPPDPALRITRSTAVPYDPDAVCPLWLETVNEIFLGDGEAIEYFHRVAGYASTGLTKEQMMLICYGHGRNGKSTLLATLRDVLGDYGGMSRWETFDADGNHQIGDDLAALRGKRLVLVIESEQGKKLAEGRVKSVTGGEAVTVRHLYGRDFEMRLDMKIMLAVNHKPVIRGNDEGIWRRLHLLEFKAEFQGDNRDLNRIERLQAERPGILRWLFEGAAKYLKDGLQQPAVVVEATKDYREESDVLGQWLEEQTEKDKTKVTTQAIVYQSYRSWALDNGHRIMSSNALGRALKERGFERTRVGKGHTAYVGIKVLPVDSYNFGGLE